MARHRNRISKFKKNKSNPSRQKSTSSNQETLEKYILDMFGGNQSLKIRFKEIVRAATNQGHKKTEVEASLYHLLENNQLKRNRNKKISLNKEKKTITGNVIINRKGFGFLVPDNGEEDLFISPSGLRNAQHSDHVEASVGKKGKFGKRSARVIKILKRAHIPIIGCYYCLPGSGGLVYPDDKRQAGPIRISSPDSKNAKDGSRVRVKLLDSYDSNREPRGIIVRIFGDAEDPKARFKAFIAQYGFSETFSPEVQAETKEFNDKITENDLNHRLDLRDQMIFTIDPEEAEDFDDALSIKKIRGQQGDYELGVHIADVGHFVRINSALDKEARFRGTSVYSSHGLLPMFPHRLSADLCSLRQGEDRLTLSVFMTISSTGEIKEGSVHRSVIHSQRRFTYAQVQHILDKTRENNSELPKWRNDRFSSLLPHLAFLAAQMRKRRLATGGIEMELPEYKIITDESNRILKISKYQIFESNHLVEECMLAANKWITTSIVRQDRKHTGGFIFRIHELPDQIKMQEFGLFVKSLGIKWPFNETNTPVSSKALNSWIESQSAHPLHFLIQRHALRALAKAEYSTENIGHYGLGFTNYTHFTSPIRRYPDLMVHRIVVDHMQSNVNYNPEKKELLRGIARSSSEKERAAMEFERNSFNIRKAEYFQEHLGETFTGIIVSLNPRGLFVEIEDMGSDGFVSSEDLGYVYFDSKLNGFVEATTLRKWKAGDKIQVVIKNVDTSWGQLDLELAD